MTDQGYTQRSIFSGTTLAALALVIIFPLLLSPALATQILLFALATLACNLLLGYTGLLSFGQGMFFGAGAYVGSLAMIHAGAGLFAAIVAAAAGSALLAAIVGALTIRRSGIYFVMLTLAFAQMVYFIAYTMSDWTGGENGLLDVPRPPVAIGPWQLTDLSGGLAYYCFIGVLFMLIFVAARVIIRSPFGSTLIAIRENEKRAAAVGYNIRNFKLLAFIISGAITGIAGIGYAMLLNFAPLSNVDLSMSETILIMTIIGGAGSLFGSLLGAASIVILGELLSPIWPRWMILLGAALIAVSLYLQGGLWGAIDSLLKRWQAYRQPRPPHGPETVPKPPTSREGGDHE